MKKATARAYANIALVKYWGKGDEKLRLPVNSSAAITLDQIYTDTTVEFSDTYAKDSVEIDGDTFSQEETDRVSQHLDRVRQLAGMKLHAKVVTKNNFPTAVGAASSASGFAALTLAASAAAGLNLSEKELSILSRQGSGSASRSISGGITLWHRGSSSDTSFAEKIEYPQEWNLRVLLVFVGEMKRKKVSTTDGMKFAVSSPYFEKAVTEAEKNIERLQQALHQKDWSAFGQVIEDESVRLHVVCMSSHPNIFYWEGTTMDIFQKLLTLREQKIDGFFTVDAGPHVHVVCQQKDVATLKKELSAIEGVNNIVECGIGSQAQLQEKHLF